MPGPAHLLRLGPAPVDQEVGCAFSKRRADPQARSMPFGVVDQPGALAAEVAIHRTQRSAQLADVCRTVQFQATVECALGGWTDRAIRRHPALNIHSQCRIGGQLRSPCCPLRMPLCDCRPVIQVAAPRRAAVPAIPLMLLVPDSVQLPERPCPAPAATRPLTLPPELFLL